MRSVVDRNVVMRRTTVYVAAQLAFAVTGSGIRMDAANRNYKF